VVIPKFIQLTAPLPPLKLTAQSRCGVIRVMEAQVHPLVVAIPRFKNWILLIIPIYAKASLKYFNQLILKNFKLILAYI
jgi:hypothetical protein